MAVATMVSINLGNAYLIAYNISLYLLHITLNRDFYDNNL